MSSVICMASAKGGSGKTVLTSTFATFLNSLGKKILMIDTDASTNGLTLMYLKEVMLQNEIAMSKKKRAYGSYEIINKEDDSLDNIEKANGRYNNPEIVKLKEGLHLIPATYSFINTETTDVQSFELGLKLLLRKLSFDYDYIFLDAQAGSDPFAYTTMKREISHLVVIVSEYDPLSAAGIERLKALFREELTYERTWILLNKILPEFAKSFSDFLQVAKYLNPIPWDAEIVKAYARRKLALDLEYGNEFTLAVSETLQTLLGEGIQQFVSSWFESKASLIKGPIQIQYSDTKRKLNALWKSKYEINRRDKFLEILKRTLSFSTSLALPMITYFIFKQQKLENDSLTMTIVISLALGMTFFLNDYLYKFSSNYLFQKGYKREVSEKNLRSEIKILEEKLEKLEVLQSAKVEELIKERGKIHRP